MIYLIGALIAAMISGRLFWKANSDSDFTVNDAVFMAIYVFLTAILSWLTVIIYLFLVNGDKVLIKRNKEE